ncbi:hypothetical protein OUZ56_026521 [Daphnia magna]|uniref:Uncharacterized protein n=1 Tax=Daphnia magna TaxID=35525 RepID=A0ABQ9ZMD9_9CRUS|nr:hypothetical protein OUZ56_026521 [Daphnia magna]
MHSSKLYIDKFVRIDSLSKDFIMSKSAASSTVLASANFPFQFSCSFSISGIPTSEAHRMEKDNREQDEEEQ